MPSPTIATEATTGINYSNFLQVDINGLSPTKSTRGNLYDQLRDTSSTTTTTITADIEAIIVVVTTPPPTFVHDKLKTSSGPLEDVFSFLNEGEIERDQPSNIDYFINNTRIDTTERNESVKALQAGITYFSDPAIKPSNNSSTQLTIQRNPNYQDYFDKDYPDEEDNYPVDTYRNDDWLYKQGHVSPDGEEEAKERDDKKVYKYEYNYQAGTQYDDDDDNDNVADENNNHRQSSEDRSKEIDYKTSRDGDNDRHFASRDDNSYATDEDRVVGDEDEDEGRENDAGFKGDFKAYESRENISNNTTSQRDDSINTLDAYNTLKQRVSKPEIESDRGDDDESYSRGIKTDNDVTDNNVTDDVVEQYDDDNNDKHEDDEHDDDNDDDAGNDYDGWNRQRIKMKHNMANKQGNDYDDDGDDDDVDDVQKTKSWDSKDITDHSNAERDYRPGTSSEMGNAFDLMIPRKSSLGAFSWSEYHHHPTNKQAILLLPILAAFMLLSILIVLLISYRRQMMNYMNCKGVWCVASRTRLKKKEFGSEESNTLLSNFQV